MIAAQDVRYVVDAADRICEVNDAWSDFARANDGEHLLPPAIIGRPIWDFIADQGTSGLYQRLMERVRAGRGPLRFGFRCDAPAVRRQLTMHMTLEDGAVCFTVRAAALEPRPRVPLLDVTVPRSGELVSMCSWCKRIETAQGRWLEVEDAIGPLGLFQSDLLPTISHGMCGECYDQVVSALPGGL